MRKALSTIRVRLVVWYLGFLAVLLIFFNVFLFITLQHFLTQDLASALRTRARTLDTALASASPEDLPAQRLNLLINASAPPGVRTTLYDTSGDVVIASTGTPAGLPAPDDRLLKMAATPRQQDSTVQQGQDSLGEHELFIWQIVRPRRGPPYIAQISISSERIGSTLRQLLAVMVLGDAATLFIAALVGLPLVGAALRPLGHMVEATRRIAAGDLSEHVQLPSGDDEIGLLATSFNHMVEQLRASFQAQRRFVADASHELRSPLTALQGSTEVLLMGAASDPKVSHQMLRSMNREIARLIRLVGELLTLSKIDAELPMRREAVDLAQLLSETAEELRTIAAPREVVTHTREAVRVTGDPDRLKQVFLNIAENAVRHTPVTGHVEIDLLRDDGRALVSIKDDGEGIPPEDLPHIFERFYSSNRSRAREKSGTGLGLAIAKAIVEAHGGDIGVRSRSGEGALFEIHLPLS